MGFRQMNPMYLFFMAMMGIALFSSMQSQGANTEMSTPEVNSERAEYLRYLSGKTEEIRAAANAQKASAEWSHPDPDVLEAVLDGPRMWERGASDPDYLHIRFGRDEVTLASKIKVKPVDSELDLEPVTKTAVQNMRAVQQSIPHCPKAIDFSGVGMIGVYMGIYLSTVIFFVTGFVRTIPEALEEAAQIDGASPFAVFRRVVLPLLRPVLATATILICLYVWNDVFYAFFVVGGRVDTLPLNLFRVASAGLYLNNWHLIFAYVILMSLPLIAVFAVAQRRIISGITGGAVK